MKKSNQEETRQHNSRLVLNTIYQHEEISRVEIARSTRLTRTTVSEIVAEFIETGLVVETGLAPSTGGKPATLLRLDPQSRLIIGIDLAEDEFRGALVDLRGVIIHAMAIPIREQNGEQALALAYTLAESLLDIARQPVIGIGIGVPGLMDPANRIVRQAVNLDWHNLPLGDLLHDRFQLPIYLANDCQAAALGEFTFGLVASCQNLIVVKAGRGVGAGIVLGGQIFHGDRGGAGEIGHIHIQDDGEICRCGKRGCLETVASSRILIQRAQQIAEVDPDSILGGLILSNGSASLEIIQQAWQSGDLQAAAMIEESAAALGTVIASLVGALNIDHIRIAGSLSRFGDALVGAIQQRVQDGILEALALQTQVRTATLGEDIVILGAASMILKNELGLF